MLVSVAVVNGEADIKGEKADHNPAVNADGTISVPAFEFPLPAELSPEARSYMIGILEKPPISTPVTAQIETAEQYRDYVENYRATMNNMFATFEAEVLKAHPVKITAQQMAGVPVEIFTPASVAVKNKNRVLINLHGGGFFAGEKHIGRIESAPIADIGKIRVVSVNYRQGYEHTFPAASEDVEKVFDELRKEYPPQNIGIYGCSAGAALAGQTISWLLDKGKPLPGAIGMLSAGAGGSGDSLYIATISMAQPAPPASAASGGSMRSSKFGYFSTAPDSHSADGHLVDFRQAPKELRARFPPTLLVTGTRSFDMSSVLSSHRSLTQVGVDTSLQVFDGMPHCFVYQHYMPEAKDAFDTTLRFFDRHLGK
ncbi:MAG: hypothetical protein VR73_14100 [Gammaproteobacteria bacterium BRH_c0]|nr:MAG: hypothetical protein VR73_14100 [Gammaproteobacteria bacterium BRH_c0]